MANSWDQLRAAGAEARARLIAAAAKQWGVDAGDITIERASSKTASGKSATFGELAGLAQQIELPGPFKPKEPDAWKLIGANKLPKVDTLPKTNGTAIYTIDVKMPNMLTCLVARPSRFHAKVAVVRCGAGAGRARRQGGVRRLAGRRRSGRRLLGGKEGPRRAEGHVGRGRHRSAQHATRSSRSTSSSPTSRAAIARNDGDTDAALSGAAKVLEATYVFPYLAHAPMEPNNCVIHRTDDGGVEMNFGSQIQTIDQGVAARGARPQARAGEDQYAACRRQLRPPRDAGRRHGGGSRRGAQGRAAQGPIKVLWTREDDIKGGRYRPIFVHKLRGGVDAEGNIVGWDQVIVGQSFMKGSPFEAGMVKNGVDQTMVEGASTLPYQIPNLRVSAHMTDVGVPTLWWRSVGSTHTAFSTETFLDQLAEAAGISVELEEEEQEDLIEQSLPQIVEGDSLQVSALTITSGETAPPKRFTEASLLSAMENPAPYMSGESHELIRKIGETGGLGTVGTQTISSRSCLRISISRSGDRRSN